MKIAVIGAAGQLGVEVVRAARSRGLDVLPLTHADCDVRDDASLDRALVPMGAGDVVVNTAAWHKVDDCELRPDLAVETNTAGAYRAARAAAKRGAAAVFISTDFVFDGHKSSPYVESDLPAPLSVYGASKFAGEALVACVPRHYVVRTSALYGAAGSSAKGGNFVETMIARARKGETPRVVTDIVTSPTATADAADLLVDVLAREAPFGIYHIANTGACSWCEFADAIFELSDLAVRAQAISSKDLGAAARRPAYSALASEKLGALSLRARPWREALLDYLRARGYAR